MADTYYDLTQTGAEVQDLLDSIGDVSDLTTTDQTTLVDAINEVDANADANTTNIAANTTNIATNTAAIGDLSDLDTSDQSDLVSAINELAAEGVLYFSSQAVSAVSSGTIMTITDDAITTDTVVLECTFASPAYITSDVTWTSYAGYIEFTGTCTTATTANVTLGFKVN